MHSHYRDSICSSTLTAGNELMNFMDAYSGYNQICMNPADEEHTTFYTDNGVSYYKVMPFGLKNAGVTYQRLISRMFTKQVGRNVEAYVDNMIVKSRYANSHCADLTETLQR